MSHNHITTGAHELRLVIDVLEAAGVAHTLAESPGRRLVEFEGPLGAQVCESYLAVSDGDCDGHDVWASVCYPAGARPWLWCYVEPGVWPDDAYLERAVAEDPDARWELQGHYRDVLTGERRLTLPQGGVLGHLSPSDESCEEW